MSESGPGAPGPGPPDTTPPGVPPAPTWPAPPPPAPPGAPIWEPTPPTPRRKHKLTWLWVLIGVLVVLVAGIVVAVVLAVDVFSKPVDATNEYYANVRAGRYRAAYNDLCTRTRTTQTFGGFLQEQRSRNRLDGRLRSYDFYIGTVNDDDGRAIGTEHRTVDRDVEVHLDKEGDTWKVCSIDDR